MTLAAVLCCTMTTVFTACNNDETALASYMTTNYLYHVEFDMSNSYSIHLLEVDSIRTSLNKAVGMDGNVYKIPEVDMSYIWERTFKAYYNK